MSVAVYFVLVLVSGFLMMGVSCIFSLWQYYYPEQTSTVKNQKLQTSIHCRCYSERHFPPNPSILICISHINLVIKLSQKTLEFLLLQIINLKNNQDTSQWPQNCPRFSCHCVRFTVQHLVPSQLLLGLDWVLWVSEWIATFKIHTLYYPAMGIAGDSVFRPENAAHWNNGTFSPTSELEMKSEWNFVSHFPMSILKQAISKTS